jgi:uncharacterized protein (TIGR02271 family)
MSRTITAMFDTRSDAESARDQLRSQIGAQAEIIDQSSGSSSSGGGESRGFFAGVKDAFMPDEDRHSYEEGIRRGGFLLCAQIDEARADEAVRILESGNSVDFDQREQQWRSEGWQGYQGSPQANFQGSPETGRREKTIEEERIPIVEEQLNVGKREVARGGARVRSFVREQPVSEQVNLREENVSIERRPVNETLSSADLNRGDLLQQREVEMRATGEEPIIGKEARVTEEMVIRKTAEQRTENVQDNVRRTEVDVEGAGGRDFEGGDFNRR